MNKGSFCFALAAILLSIQIATGLDHSFNSNYKIEWETNTGLFQLTIIVDTVGWIGFGFNPNSGEMNGAELVMAGLKAPTATQSDENPVFVRSLPSVKQVDQSEPYIEVFKGGDDHSRTPINNHLWSIDSAKSKQEGSRTTVVLTRPLVVSENSGMITLQESSDVYVLWSYGSADNVQEGHIAMGSAKLNLFNHNHNSASAVQMSFMSLIAAVVTLRLF